MILVKTGGDSLYELSLGAENFSQKVQSTKFLKHQKVLCWFARATITSTTG